MRTPDCRESGSKVPISGAVADLSIASNDGGSELTLHYSYTPNRLVGWQKGLQRESERIATSG